MKAALISYTQTLAETLGPDNINVNAVCPGIVWTDAWRGNAARAAGSAGADVAASHELDAIEAFLAQQVSQSVAAPKPRAQRIDVAIVECDTAQRPIGASAAAVLFLSSPHGSAAELTTTSTSP